MVCIYYRTFQSISDPRPPPLGNNKSVLGVVSLFLFLWEVNLCPIWFHISDILWNLSFSFWLISPGMIVSESKYVAVNSFSISRNNYWSNLKILLLPRKIILMETLSFCVLTWNVCLWEVYFPVHSTHPICGSPSSAVCWASVPWSFQQLLCDKGIQVPSGKQQLPEAFLIWFCRK